MNEDLVQTVRRAQKGNHDAFVRLVKEYESTMYRVAGAFLRSDSECADAMQETVIKAYKSIRNLREPIYFKTWLLQILTNECRKIYNQRKGIIPVAELSEESYHPDPSGKLVVTDALQELDQELRVVITLYYLEDLPVKEVARLLDTPEGTVKSRLARAREKLAVIMQPSAEGRVSYE